MISSYDSNETELFSRPYFANATGTLEGILLDRWFSGNLTYDALFLQELPSRVKVSSGTCEPDQHENCRFLKVSLVLIERSFYLLFRATEALSPDKVGLHSSSSSLSVLNALE